MKAYKPLTEADVEFTVEALPEDTPIRGSFASGDDAEDEALAQSIERDYNSGNDWAWCVGCAFLVRMLNKTATTSGLRAMAMALAFGIVDSVR